MSRTWKDSKDRGNGRRRNISVRGVRRDPPDVHKLSRALIALVMARAEAEAASDDKSGDPPPTPDKPKPHERPAGE